MNEREDMVSTFHRIKKATEDEKPMKPLKDEHIVLELQRLSVGQSTHTEHIFKLSDRLKILEDKLEIILGMLKYKDSVK